MKTKGEYPIHQRTLFMAFLAPIFLGLLPYAFVTLGGSLDRWLGLPSLAFPPPIRSAAGIVAGADRAGFRLQRAAGDAVHPGVKEAL